MTTARGVDSSICKCKATYERCYSSALSAFARPVTAASTASEGDSGIITATPFTSVSSSPATGVLVWAPGAVPGGSSATAVASLAIAVHWT